MWNEIAAWQEQLHLRPDLPAVLQKRTGEHDGREAPLLAQLRRPLQTGGR